MDQRKLLQLESNIRSLNLPEKRWLLAWLAQLIQEKKLSHIDPVESQKALTLITRDPEIMSGVPVFSGTRVPVQSLIDHLKAGDSLETFLAGFPSVTREQTEEFLEIALQAALIEDVHARVAG